MTLQPTGLGTKSAEATPPRGGSASRRVPARAFTLVELLITLSLLALMASMAWPALQNQITASELPESAERMRSAIAMARCEAVMEHRRFRIRFATGEQDPKIEYEADPINQPGAYIPSVADWANEPMLLADVQVHDIQTGRPVYTQALSTTTDPDAARKQAEKVEEDKREREQLRSGRAKNSEQEADIDPLRPAIVFEADGSTEWATLIVARVKPEETLEEEQPQIWIILDGRTGMATIRPKVTKEQLSDSKFYVPREKLELPDTLSSSDLSFDITQNADGTTAMPGTTDQSGTTAQGTNADGTSQQGGDTSQTGETVKEVAQQAQDAVDSLSGSTTTDSKIEDALENSNLTEEEKNNVRQGFPKKSK